MKEVLIVGSDFVKGRDLYEHHNYIFSIIDKYRNNDNINITIVDPNITHDMINLYNLYEHIKHVKKEKTIMLELLKDAKIYDIVILANCAIMKEIFSRYNMQLLSFFNNYDTSTFWCHLIESKPINVNLLYDKINDNGVLINLSVVPCVSNRVIECYDIDKMIYFMTQSVFAKESDLQTKARMNRRKEEYEYYNVFKILFDKIEEGCYMKKLNQ